MFDETKYFKDLKIEGTKAEPLFLQLMMQSLNVGGRCAVIIPDGVLFNDAKLYKENRDSIDLVIIENARHAFRGKKQNKVLLTTIKDWIQNKYSTFFP